MEMIAAKQDKACAISVAMAAPATSIFREQTNTISCTLSQIIRKSELLMYLIFTTLLFSMNVNR